MNSQSIAIGMCYFKGRKNEVTIYLDAVWTLNFFLDMMLILLTQATAKINTKKWRIILGSFVASLLVPLTLYYPHSFFTSIYGKVFYSVLIILVSFPYRTVYQLMKMLLIFYFITFSIGGGLIATHYLLHDPIVVSSEGLLTFNSGYGDPVSWLFILVGFPCTWIFTKIRMDKHAVDKIRYDQLCPVTIQIKNKSYTTMGYIDSGNQLTDPLTRNPVIICDESFLQQWFSNHNWLKMKEAHFSSDISKIPEEWERLIHVIPYRGVEGTSDFLLAIRPDEIVVSYNQGTITTKKVLIGIQFASLTTDQAYHCLLQPQIMKLMTMDSA